MIDDLIRLEEFVRKGGRSVCTEELAGQIHDVSQRVYESYWQLDKNSERYRYGEEVHSQLQELALFVIRECRFSQCPGLEEASMATIEALVSECLGSHESI
jgi:hypothetical protein